MNFEQAQAITEKIETQKEFDRELKTYMNPSSISRSELEGAMHEIFPLEDVMVHGTEERRRHEASERLRANMRRWLNDNRQANLGRTEGVQLPRVIAYDTLLNLPHPEQNEEYERRYEILVNGTPEQKKELLFAALHEAKQGYTHEKLLTLTDEEIADDFEGLNRLHCFADNVRAISEMKDLELTEDQKKELLDFEDEFGASSLVYVRAKLIANPRYSMVKGEQFPAFNMAELTPEQMFDRGENIEAFNNFMTESFNVQNMAQTVLKSAVAQMVAEAPVEQITWYRPNGEKMEAMSDLPIGDLYADGKLTAVLPNNTVKEITVNRLPGGGMATAVEEYTLARYTEKQLPKEIDEQVQQTLEKISASIERVDPWYIHSSEQFKDVKAQAEKIRKEFRAMGPNPTKYQRDRLRTQMNELSAACDAYISFKEQKDELEGLNERDSERLNVVKAIREFTQQQVNRVNTLSDYTAQMDNVQEREQFQREFQENREKNQQGYAQQFEQVKSFQRSEPERNVNRKRATMAECMNKATAYRNINCPPSNECGDALEKLHRSLHASLGNLATVAGRNSLSQTEQTRLKRDMATLTVFHLVLTERGANFSGNAGPIEQALAKNPDALIRSVENLPEFSRCIGEITPVRVEDFLMNDGARKVSRELIAHGLNQAKAPAQPAPEKSVQKDMQNPLQK